MDLSKKALSLHKTLSGKLTVQSKVPVNNLSDLSLIYTPGVGAVSTYLATHPNEASSYTFKSNSVAVVSDGSAVLGLGNIGPLAALPVMEGKCQLFQRFAQLDAVPIVLQTQDPDEIIKVVQAISPTFGAINLEDISAPKCFYIEKSLQSSLNIPVLHDDQWGTAIVVLAGLINACKVTNKDIKTCKMLICGAGAAGVAITEILLHFGLKNILVVDSQGIVYRGRAGNSGEKKLLAQKTNPHNIEGSLEVAFQHSDVAIGVSKAGLFTPKMISLMNPDSIVFALANPTPEITPKEANTAGAAVVATGRSDFPNQINNALAFPGVFRGALQHRIRSFDLSMLVKASQNLSSLVKAPTKQKIIPSIFDPGVMQSVASAIC